MKKTSFVLGMLGILAIALVFGMTLVSCGGDDDPPVVGDSWTDVTSMEQVNGTWKGSFTMAEEMTIKEWVEEMGDYEEDGFSEGGFESMDQMLEEMLGDMKVTVTVELTIIISTATQKGKMEQKAIMTFTGGKINDEGIWDQFKDLLSEISTDPEGESGVTFDDTTHSAINVGYEDLPLDDMKLEGAGVKINQDGTKIIIPPDLMGDEMPEIMLTKQ